MIIYGSFIYMVVKKAVANSLVGQVLARPLFLKVKKIPFYEKQVISKSTRAIFELVQLVILRMIQQIEKPYDEVENNWLLTHAKYLCYTSYSTVQKLSNLQSAKVICRFDELRIAYSKRQKP